MNRLDEIDARIKSRKEEIDRRLADRMAAVDAKLGIAPVTASATNAAAYGQADGCGLQTCNSIARADVDRKLGIELAD